MVAPVNAFSGCCRNANFAGGWAGAMVRTEEAIPLDTPCRIAIACTVEEALIEIGPVYAVEVLEGTVPSVVT